MQNTPTPGPWYYAYGQVWTTPDGPEDGGTGILVANRSEPKTTPVERDANARLAAQAPALLAALQECSRAITVAADAYDSEILRSMADYANRTINEASRA